MEISSRSGEHVTVRFNCEYVLRISMRLYIVELGVTFAAICMHVDMSSQ